MHVFKNSKQIVFDSSRLGDGWGAGPGKKQKKHQGKKTHLPTHLCASSLHALHLAHFATPLQPHSTQPALLTRAAPPPMAPTATAAAAPDPAALRRKLLLRTLPSERERERERESNRESTRRAHRALDRDFNPHLCFQHSQSARSSRSSPTSTAATWPSPPPSSSPTSSPSGSTGCRRPCSSSRTGRCRFRSPPSSRRAPGLAARLPCWWARGGL